MHIDTLTAMRTLEESGIPQEHAEAIALVKP